MAFAGFSYLVTAFVLQAAVVHGAIADLNGRRSTFFDCLTTGLRHFFPSIVIALLYMIGVLGGMVLLIVPGVILAIAWCIAIPVRVVELASASQALGRSYELTKGYRWPTFGVLLLIGIFQIVLSLAMGGISGVIIATGDDPSAVAGGWSTIAASTIAGMISVVLSASATASIYFELRQIKEGIGPEALASVFD